MPQTIWARVETPPPFGQCPNRPGIFLSGASLSVYCHKRKTPEDSCVCLLSRVIALGPSWDTNCCRGGRSAENPKLGITASKNLISKFKLMSIYDLKKLTLRELPPQLWGLPVHLLEMLQCLAGCAQGQPTERLTLWLLRPIFYIYDDEIWVDGFDIVSTFNASVWVL